MQDERIPTGIQCPECGKGQLISFVRTEDFDFGLGDETVKVHAENVPVKQCDQCGEVISGPAAAKARHEAICRAVGLLTPSEIKALRDEFGWSQQDLADLTDFGVATVSRWERARLLQNRSANKVLLALRGCPAFREYLEGLTASKIKKNPEGLGHRGGFESVHATARIKCKYSDAGKITALAAVFEFSRN